MEHETFWKTLDAAREAAQRAGQSAGEALDALSAAARDADLYERCRAGAEYLQKQLGNFRPEVLLILGSGLGFLGDEVEHPLLRSTAPSPISNIPPRRATGAASYSAPFAANAWP